MKRLDPKTAITTTSKKQSPFRYINVDLGIRSSRTTIPSTIAAVTAKDHDTAA